MSDNAAEPDSRMAQRFRGYLPVIVDIETAGFNARRDAMLEIAAVLVKFNERGDLIRGDTHASHVEPFPGANLDPEALAFNGIDPYHPFRMAKPERDALQSVFLPIRQAVRESGCKRAILVGHNPAFDIGFLNAAVDRTKIKRNPFHPFSTFDTATLGALIYGQTVLARIASAAGIAWDADKAHSAVYDAEQTAELFCMIVNRWKAAAAVLDAAPNQQTSADQDLPG